MVSRQEFGPSGSVRLGGVSGTTLNYTGQRCDDTGLLFYNARYYDPAIGRFISADTVVPGNASGGMDGVALRPLTVAFHEPGFIATLNGEGANADKLHWGGPVNPQALNRYSYVNNNPMRWTDPSGHTIYMSHKDAAVIAKAFSDLAYKLTYDGNNVADAITDAMTIIASNTTGAVGAIFSEIIGRLGTLGKDKRVFGNSRGASHI